MLTVLTVSLLLSADHELSLLVDGTSLSQRDPLLVKAVVSNRGQGALAIDGPSALRGNRIRYQRRIDGKWQPLPAMSSYLGAGDAIPGGRRLLDEKSTYAEYDSILLAPRPSNKFIFESVGRYEIRAVAHTSAGELTSDAVLIDVEARTPEQLATIDKARGSLELIGAQVLTRKIPAELVALKEIGGNIGEAVQNLLLIEAIQEGRVKVDQHNVATFLGRRIDGLEWEFGLTVLGHFYERKRDWKHLVQVVDALPDVTLATWRWQYYLDVYQTPHFVPGKTKKD